uniref:G_PROTEIN_RECEP_F1_2 domain-containing protein n=1 Tax=Plectus sambesii TaxID=2011161 RepID=A0A914UTA7_9BILA
MRSIKFKVAALREILNARGVRRNPSEIFLPLTVFRRLPCLAIDPPFAVIHATMSADDDDADADSFSISSSDWLLFFFSSLYIIVPLLGIALNSYVLLRLRRIAQESVFRFETTSALPLTAMSMADTICLCAELFQ